MEIKEIFEKCKRAKEWDNEIIIYGAGLAAHLIYNSLKNRWGGGRSRLFLYEF